MLQSSLGKETESYISFILFELNFVLIIVGNESKETDILFLFLLENFSTEINFAET